MFRTGIVFILTVPVSVLCRYLPVTANISIGTLYCIIFVIYIVDSSVKIKISAVLLVYLVGNYWFQYNWQRFFKFVYLPYLLKLIGRYVAYLLTYIGPVMLVRIDV